MIGTLRLADPQNDFLKPGGAFYDAVKQSVNDNQGSPSQPRGWFFRRQERILAGLGWRTHSTNV